MAPPELRRPILYRAFMPSAPEIDGSACCECRGIFIILNKPSAASGRQRKAVPCAADSRNSATSWKLIICELSEWRLFTRRLRFLTAHTRRRCSRRSEVGEPKDNGDFPWEY